MCYGENEKSISCGVAYPNRTLYKDGLGTELVKILRYFMPFTQTGNGLVKVKTDEAEVKKEGMKMTCFPKEIQSSVSRQQKQLLSFSLFFYFSYKIEGKIFLDHAPAYDYCIYHSISHSILSPISSICF